MPTVVSYIGVTLALVGLLWTAASKWQNLNDRVTTLEDSHRFYHGDDHFERKLEGAK